jgi:hypothetical protein
MNRRPEAAFAAEASRAVLTARVVMIAFAVAGAALAEVGWLQHG